MKSDDEIDAIVKAASQFPVDEGRMAQAVLTRIRDDDAGLFGLFGGHGRGVALAFSAVLVATPIAVTQFPSGPRDDAVALLLLGEGLWDQAALDQLLTDEGLE